MYRAESFPMLAKTNGAMVHAEYYTDNSNSRHTSIAAVNDRPN